MDRQVKVKSLVNDPVVLYIKNYNFEREFSRDGATLHVPFDILFDGLSEYAVRALFTKGYLQIVEKQDRIDLNLETEDENPVVSFSTEEIKDLLKTDDKFFEETLKTLPEAQKEKLLSTAIAMNFTDFNKSKIIEKYTKVNIIEAVKNKTEN